jgi:hypothetical protein
MDKQTMKQSTVIVPKQPGALSHVTALISREGVNIDFVSTESLGDIATLRFIFEKENGLRRKIEAAGYKVLENQVLCVELPNRPGELNKLAQRLAEERVDIRYLFATPHGATSRVVFSVDRTDDAAAILKECARSLAGSAD